MEDEVHVLSGERRPRTKHCSTSDVYGDNDRLREHCELVTEAYTRSFVIGTQQTTYLHCYLYTGCILNDGHSPAEREMSLSFLPLLVWEEKNVSGFYGLAVQQSKA